MLRLMLGAMINARGLETSQEGMKCHYRAILEVKVFDCWGIDFIVPFLPSFNNKYILVIVDYVSK